MGLFKIFGGAKNAKKIFNEGVERFNSKDYYEAIKSFDAALAIDPEFLEALYRRAFVKLAVEDYAGALKDLEKFQTATPTVSAELYGSKSSIRSKMGDYPGAIEELNAAIGISPKNPTFYYSRGLQKEKSRRYGRRT
ncbi:MAG TPA: tetratricopeptide repeat protein [Ignavibacteriales bacterium]|nr:tetratricopeptide repeat protein [Ignavibacteriales bacterium]